MTNIRLAQPPLGLVHPLGNLGFATAYVQHNKEMSHAFAGIQLNANPGFPAGGGANRKGGGVNLIFLILKNPCETEKFVRRGTYSPGSANPDHTDVRFKIFISFSG